MIVNYIEVVPGSRGPPYGTNDNANPFQTAIPPLRRASLSRSSSVISIEPHYRTPISACRAHSMSLNLNETPALPRTNIYYLLFLPLSRPYNLDSSEERKG